MPLRTLMALALLIAGTGCAHKQPVTLDEPIGPVNSSAPAPDRGSLIVYSDTETNFSDTEYPTHTSYALYTAEGELVRKVDNRSGAFGASPATVSLAAGRYKVVAKGSSYRLVTAWVIIREGLTTVVDLNQEALPRDAGANGHWVRLPNVSYAGLPAACRFSEAFGIRREGGPAGHPSASRWVRQLILGKWV